MSWWSVPQAGDWVRTVTVVPVTFTDRVGGGGLPSGTRGVVLATYGGRVEVELDAQWGSITTTVRTGDVRVVRRDGGVGSFRQRTRRLVLARLAVGLMLALPLLQYAISYVWTYHSFDGITAELVTGTLLGVGDSIGAALSEPWKALIYFGVLAVLGRFTSGRRAR